MSHADEEEEKRIPVSMTKDHIKSGLSQVGKTFDGSSVAFIRLNLENKELDIISEDLRNFKNLRYVNLSRNHFDQVNILSHLPCIIKLELQGNRLSSLEIFNNPDTFQYLQHLDLSKNMIQILTGLQLPKLLTLKLTSNQISTIQNFHGHSTLKSLDLKGNKLSTLQHLENLTALEELWLADNRIDSLHGLKNFPALKKIHLRKNAFTTFEGAGLPELPSLVYLNFRENELGEVSKLGELQKYKSLSKIVITDNPVKAEPSGDAKKETLIVLPQLKFIGKEEISVEEREDAINEAAERKRLAEEAEKAAKEAMKEGENREAEED